MNILRQVGIVLLHWTWGVIQTLIGFIVFLIFVNRRHLWLNGNVCTEVRGNWGGITLGMFTFVDYMPEGEQACYDKTVRHEHGHTLQSILLGPLWLLIIALPSIVWAGCFNNYRAKHHIGYYSLYCEMWADKWGDVKR